MADSSSSYRFVELRRRAFEQLPCAQGRALHGLQRLDKAALSFDKAGKRADDEVQAIVTGAKADRSAPPAFVHGSTSSERHDDHHLGSVKSEIYSLRFAELA